MASTPALLRTLFMPKTILADMVRPNQVPIYKPNYYRNNAIRIRGASSSSKKPPITKGGGQRINSTDTAASENKEYSGSSITDQKGFPTAVLHGSSGRVSVLV
ncbi:hypothetical protein TIFTF001_045272 [Ficus carica]|uniref:Uncharacterized protein n=1 Tax=Ficus carica TaxID=3494 RepID=A0AA88CHH8_FICCA|nr:hypothetical protein TIFTF001_045272 [Ficus carica]